MSSPEKSPRVSIVIAAYKSHDTVARCLESFLGQTYRDFEIIVVDSCPTDATEKIVASGFPGVRYEHVKQRMLPGAARNHGVKIARGELFVFADPDVYAAPDWLEKLVAAYDETGKVIVGALACYGRDRLDVAIHLVKFSKWLPGGAPRPVDMAPTANMLCSRKSFEAAGGLTDHLLSDAQLSWALVDRGEELWFEPRAVVEHHHLSTCRQFLWERFSRGALFAELRASWFRGRRWLNALYLGASLLPLRIVRILGFSYGQCRRAGATSDFFASSPLICLGHLASLAGECRGHWKMLWTSR